MAVVWKDDDGFSTGDIFQGGRTNYLNNDAWYPIFHVRGIPTSRVEDKLVGIRSSTVGY